MYKHYTITIPIIGVASMGIILLSRLKLDVTAGLVFFLIYLGVYIPGYIGLMEPNIVILFLNSILVLTMFFIKKRKTVFFAYIVGSILNIRIIWNTEWSIHEYVIASFVFLIVFYTISSFIYGLQDRLENENATSHEKNQKISLLLNEIHHRVNNNLQTISSLLYLQSSYMTDVEAKEAVAKGQQRVASLALIHRNLYNSGNHSSINMHEYLSSLTDYLENAYKNDKDIRVNLNVEDKELVVEEAIPLGLITNELITNAYKYAFNNNKAGTLDITFSMDENSKFTLIVKDSGPGKKDDFEGFGSQLITLLTKQLNADFSVGVDGGYWSKISNSADGE
jgi:two-component sensor histidine kinase